MKRRKRLPDGSFGELEEVFDSKEPTLEELQNQMLDFQEYVLQLELEKLMNEGGM